ncbi:ribosomal protection-like ABC-F family protein [Adonisia turfae]|uniref:ABC transporter ATP-binding protein n=1 Tax=Adonisia turfae CCMR0081 TaxID=2292702 RepID=A0A6M0RJV2_9CYAN|nr:ABC-F family ATP-binding cassette domain-containing protein [Adonisia turfae]NEZ56517.1 ABC transporter ATP-binding protein [Adonisia turfae CCMR0081]
MSNPQRPYVIAESLGYAIESTRTLFQGISLSITLGDRIALVGPNGIGKSTLLRILGGQLRPTQGTVSTHGAIYYLPQLNTIRASLRSESVFDFLNTISDEWWEIEQLLATAFSTNLDLSLSMQSLSGGELTKLFLAMGLAQSPDLLLLDEPTNHLDYLALEELVRVLDQYQGAFVVVSHKPSFLDQVAKTTWELTATGLHVYGGNFSYYREQKQLEETAKIRSHETARKELKRAKATAIREQKRASQSHRNGRRQALNGNMPRIVAGNLKRKAEVAAGKLKEKHDKAVTAATQKVATTKIKTHKTTSIQLEENGHKHRNLIDIQKADLWVGEQLLLQAIELQVSSCDRIAIAGPNGSGKSSLIKAILDVRDTPAHLQGGNIHLANMRTVYLDQTYDLVDRTQTVLQNMQRANPTLTYQLLRQQLGHFLFFNDDAHKMASVLSGGELARLAIAMLTISELDLLILDEPTNNLDITTVDQMVTALNNYHSALWVISHDLDFLSRIRINRSFQLKARTLQQTAYLPKEKAHYRSSLTA